MSDELERIGRMQSWPNSGGACQEELKKSVKSLRIVYVVAKI
jgi:hypothetical protein